MGDPVGAGGCGKDGRLGTVLSLWAWEVFDGNYCWAQPLVNLDGEGIGACHGSFWQHQSIQQWGCWQRPEGDGSQGTSPEQTVKALTCSFMAGVASTLVASG